MDFWQELWDFVSRNSLNLSTKLVRDIHAVGRNIQKGEDSNFDAYVALTWCSRDVAKKLKNKLPDSLHTRMVLGVQNEYTKDYVRRFGV